MRTPVCTRSTRNVGSFLIVYTKLLSTSVPKYINNARGRPVTGRREGRGLGLEKRQGAALARKKRPRSLPALFAPYQSSFSPNCTWRAAVDVLVIAPAVPERPVRLVAVGGVNTMRFGVLKFARFKTLKSSARNCMLSRS